MVKVDSKGRIVLPSEVRDELELRPGSEVAVTVEGDRVVVEPEADPEQVLKQLEAAIEDASANRERRRQAAGSEERESGIAADPIAATQREIIRRGAADVSEDQDLEE